MRLLRQHNLGYADEVASLAVMGGTNFGLQRDLKAITAAGINLTKPDSTARNALKVIKGALEGKTVCTQVGTIHQNFLQSGDVGTVKVRVNSYFYSSYITRL